MLAFGNFLNNVPGFDLEAHPAPVDLDMAVLRKSAAEIFPYAAGVSLAGGGEPLMARHFDAALDVVAAAGVPHVDFVTNATLLTERRIRKAIESGGTLAVDGINRARAAAK